MVFVDPRLRRLAVAEVVLVAVMAMVCVAMPSLQDRALVCKAKHSFKQVRAAIVSKAMRYNLRARSTENQIAQRHDPLSRDFATLCQAGFPRLQRFHSHRDWCLAPRGSQVFIYLLGKGRVALPLVVRKVADSLSRE